MNEKEDRVHAAPNKRGAFMAAALRGLLCAAVACGTVTAATAQNVNITYPRTIKQVRVYQNYAVIQYEPAGDANGCTGGSASSNVAIVWSGAATDAKSMLAHVLAAFYTGRQIGIGVNGCHTWSTGNDIPKVSRIDVQ